VYQRRKASRSSNDVTRHHIEDIIVHFALMQRSDKVDSFGQPCMKTWRISSRGVERVRGTETSIQEMPCHSPTISRLSSSMSGELTTWDHPKVKELWVHLGGSWLHLQVGWSQAM
jgi:hypothetical protein